MSGTGQPGKTEFPASWNGAAILDAVTAVGFSPDTVRKQWNDRWKARGTYHDVPITVIIDPDAAIRTAWPDEGGPGVVRNPEARP
jgi:Bacterial EndoU nuclease